MKGQIEAIKEFNDNINKRVKKYNNEYSKVEKLKMKKSIKTT
jgi:hypothetical protein